MFGIFILFCVRREKGDAGSVVVEKVVNNNIISSRDESGREILLVGRGLGWQARPGQPVDRTRIEKIFRMDTPDSTDRLRQLFLEVDLESIRASTKIIEYARETLQKRLNKNLYITLTDHISFAVERQRKGIEFHSMLYLETKKFYAREFAIGIHALDIIREEMDVSLPESEAVAIAIHIVNAEYDCDMGRTTEILKILQSATNIVRYTLHIGFDEESLDYQRFLTHMLFFGQRVLENRVKHSGDDFLFGIMRTQYPKEFDCALRIRSFVEKEYSLKVPDEEVAFLSVHIARLANHGRNPQAADQ